MQSRKLKESVDLLIAKRHNLLRKNAIFIFEWGLTRRASLRS